MVKKKKEKSSSVIKAHEYKERLEREIKEQEDSKEEEDPKDTESQTKFLLRTVDELQGEMTEINNVMKDLERHYTKPITELKD